MNRQLIALCAAMTLVGTLTACSKTPADNTPNKGVENGTTTTPSGTSYPRSTRYGVNNGYNNAYRGNTDGRYYAYPDGAVAPGKNGATRDLERVGEDVAGGTRNLMRGVGDMIDDVSNGVNDTGRALGSAVDHNQM